MTDKGGTPSGDICRVEVRERVYNGRVVQDHRRDRSGGPVGGDETIKEYMNGQRVLVC